MAAAPVSGGMSLEEALGVCSPELRERHRELKKLFAQQVEINAKLQADLEKAETATMSSKPSSAGAAQESPKGIAGRRSIRAYHDQHGVNLECKKCKCAFETAEALCSHLAQSEVCYTSGKSIVCDCGWKPGKISRYRQHLNTYLGKRSHKCSDCGELFLHIGNLNVHKKKHENPLSNACKCGKRFQQASSLKRHKLGCKKGEERCG